MSYNVYKHTSPSGKVYIGITSLNVNERWANGKGYRNQKVFWRAIQKYGWGNFKHEILFTGLSEVDAKLKEIELIDFYKSNCTKWQNPTYGYNSTDGGDHSRSGFETSLDIRQKISNSEYHLNKRKAIDCFDLNGNFLKTYDDLGSIALENNVQKTNVVKCCAKKIKSLNGKIYRYHDETNGMDIEPYKRDEPKSKKCVSQYDLNGSFIRTFSSIREIEKIYGYADSNISQCCHKKYNTSNGFIWIFGTPDEIGEVKPRNDISRTPKKIAMYDLEGNFIREFDSIAEAKRNVPKAKNINKVLKGKRNKAGGYVWKYLES